MTPDQSVTVKGSPVRSLQTFVERDLTAEQRAAAFGNLPPEYATRLQTPIPATETIPVHMLNRLTEEAARAKGEPLEDFARRAGRNGAADAIHGIYRFFALVLTPAAVLSKAGHMWTSLYNRGQLRVEDETSTSARLVLHDFPSERACCSRVTGWMERMAEMTGVTVEQIEHTKCFARSGQNCEWEIRWK